MPLAGAPSTAVASIVGLARQTVCLFKALLDEGGNNARRTTPSRGRSAQSDQEQLAGIRPALPAKSYRTRR